MGYKTALTIIYDMIPSLDVFLKHTLILRMNLRTRCSMFRIAGICFEIKLFYLPLLTRNRSIIL